MRSSWKLVPTELAALRSSFLKKLNTNGEIKTWGKGLRLFSDLLEKRLHTYNGVKFVEVAVKRESLQQFLGQFVLTKRITSDIHTKTKKNKKGKLNKHKKK